MGKKCFVMALAVFAFGFGTALRSNAGTDMIEPYRAPAPSYNYAPPPPRACRIMFPASSRRRLHRARFVAITVAVMVFTVATGSTAATLTGAGTIITGTNSLCRGAVSAAARCRKRCAAP